MQKPNRWALRVLAAVALAAVIVPASSTLLATGAGRDFSRCVQQCNTLRLACDDRCTTDCYDMFPGDVAARNACKNTCHETCITESKDCKLVCKAIKNGETIEEP